MRAELLIILFACVLHPAQAFSLDWAIIVHPSRKAMVESSEVAQIYLKQRRFWGDGTPIVPVNHGAGSPAREAFSRAIFGKGSRSRVNYWNRRYFQGVFPPIALASNEAVLRFVAAEPRAIGYVPATLVNESVRTAGLFTSSE